MSRAEDPEVRLELNVFPDETTYGRGIDQVEGESFEEVARVP